jgi:hypothetical protein
MGGHAFTLAGTECEALNVAGLKSIRHEAALGSR